MIAQQIRMGFGWGIAVVLGVLMLMPHPPMVEGPLRAELLDLGHVIFFGLVTWLFLKSDWAPRFSGRQLLLWVLVVTLFGGLIIEWLQTGIGRDFDWRDLARNLCGGSAALAVHCAVQAGSGRERLLYGGLVVLYAGIGASSFVTAATDEYRLSRDFPALATFETSRELRRWNCLASTKAHQKADGTSAARMSVQFFPAPFSRVGMHRFRGDWRGYEAVSFRIFNPSSETYRMGLKIYDRQHREAGGGYHDRFNADVALLPGANEVRVSLAEVARGPESREMDMAKIVSIDWFFADLVEPRVLLMESVRLK